MQREQTFPEDIWEFPVFIDTWKKIPRNVAEMSVLEMSQVYFKFEEPEQVRSKSSL